MKEEGLDRYIEDTPILSLRRGKNLADLVVNAKKKVGKTQNRIMDRFIGHRADLRGDDCTKPAYHFKQEGHSDEDMGVIVIEEVKGRDDMYRVTRERFWINCLGTYNEENKRK